ncbi:NlpC/P60 family protein [Sporosarcina sp. ACRSL]|uniref:C40 family peptidase n=1 Tax=Sporosarcina sp. ACRSL TaxID=2918215 RepID=UPI001EF59CC2|nr:NlpC/P60 family protein [Sporosarcina sp. ACRSL]MCG7345205.1 NlpC/P60 family protein [Sporosarcina sp. ACRSL]
MKRKILSAALITCVSVSSLAVPTFDQTQTVSAATVSSLASQQAVEAKADQLIQTAKSLIGKSTYSTAEYKPTYPYKFSCATFLMYIFEKHGVDLATYNENFMMQQGTPVAKGKWQKGDLLFFKSKTTGTDPDHVAMYIGDNKVIHMADPKQNIVISDLNSKPYYTEKYVGATRVLPSLMSSDPATKGDNIVSLAYDLKDEATIGSVNNESSKKFTSTGFVKHVYKKNGVTLDASNLKELQSKGTTVSRSDLKKGDLVFFSSKKGSKTPSLVAIYGGDHRLILPLSGGVKTRVLLVDYYNDNYITAKRVIKDVKGTTTVSKPSTTKTEPSESKPTSTATASSKSESSNTKTATSESKPSNSNDATSADKLVNFANSLMDKAKFGYEYNVNTLTFTGAGFTYYVYKENGIDLKSKLASQQSEIGSTVSKSNLKKGDLLFFSLDNKATLIKQTGIYIGDNQFISLSTSGKVVKQSLSSKWATQNFVKAQRVL